MSSPEEPGVGRPDQDAPRWNEPRPGRSRRDRLEDNPLVGWAKAIAGGIADTAKDMLEAGREGAREAMDEGWERFDRKTKQRRD